MSLPRYTRLYTSHVDSNILSACAFVLCATPLDRMGIYGKLATPSSSCLNINSLHEKLNKCTGLLLYYVTLIPIFGNADVNCLYTFLSRTN